MNKLFTLLVPILLSTGVYAHTIKDSNAQGINNFTQLTWTNSDTGICNGLQFPKKLAPNTSFSNIGNQFIVKWGNSVARPVTHYCNTVYTAKSSQGSIINVPLSVHVVLTTDPTDPDNSTTTLEFMTPSSDFAKVEPGIGFSMQSHG
jgi:hypothetical protein